jgi:hyaluronan synthase
MDARRAPEGAPLDTERERRRLERARDRFAVALLPARVGAALMRGCARDYDSEGLCVEAPEALPVGRAVRASFELPESMTRPFRGLPCKLPARVRLVRETARLENPYDVVLQWELPLAALVGRAVASHQRETGAIIVGIIFAVMYLNVRTMAYFWYSPFIYLYTMLLAVYFLSRFILSGLHRNPGLNGYTPAVTIVISVRNEQEAIVRTLDTCYAADYPEDKREVIVVNDGSTDRTPEVLEECRKRHPGLRIFTLPPSGKRHGMATGVRNAKGEVVVFVDSDTFLFPTALRHIVSGFDDPTLGAAAGHTEVENAAVNWLTGLQDVRYYLSFKLMKTAESVFGLVTCCPGCLSAYRREYLLKILDPWLNQMFLGAPATFGDDRSLTNYILKDHRVIYNEHAICTTLVPETWKRYLTQQVRWKKSWLRETLRAACYMHKKQPVGALSFYVTSACSVLSPLMCVKLFFVLLTQREMSMFYYSTGLTLMALLQCLYVLRKRPSSRWLLGFIMVAAQVVIMGPQTYYAILTMRKNHWGTR